MKVIVSNIFSFRIKYLKKLTHSTRHTRKKEGEEAILGQLKIIFFNSRLFLTHSSLHIRFRKYLFKLQNRENDLNFCAAKGVGNTKSIDCKISLSFYIITIILSKLELKSISDCFWCVNKWVKKNALKWCQQLVKSQGQL